MLLFGIVSAVCAAAFLMLGKTAAVCCAVSGASVLLLCFVLRKKLVDKAFIPFTCVALIICGLSFLLFQNINVDRARAYFPGEHSVIAFVCEIPVKDTENTFYSLKTTEIDGKKSVHKVYFTDYGSKYDFSLYDTVSFKKTQFEKPENIYKSFLSEKMFLGITDFESLDVLFRQRADIIFHILKFKEKCTEKIKIYLPNNEAGVLSGMLFGDKTDLEDEIYSSFKVAGVSHLLAVSGLHTSLWCGVLYAILKLFKVKEKAISIISLVFLFLLCVVSAFSPSVLRASFMMALVLIAPLFKRQADALNSLGFAFGIMILSNVYILYSVGFNLSVAATAGVILSGVFGRTKEEHHTGKKRFFGKFAVYIKSAFSTSLFATVFTLPFCAYYFGSCSVIAPITNILCLRLAFASLVSGLASVILSFLPFGIGGFLSYYLFKIPQFLLRLLIKVISLLAKIPYACVPVSFVTVICVFSVAALFTAVYLLLKNKSVNTAFKTVCYSFFAVLFLCSYFFSFWEMPCNREVSVVSDRGTPLIVVRNGRNISLIGVPCNNSGYSGIKEFLPLTNEQNFENLIITGGINTKNKLSEILKNYSPEKIYSPIWCFEDYLNSDFSQVVFRENTGEVKSGREIIFQCIDNYSEKYVIIKNGGKRLVFSVSGYNENGATEYLEGNPELVVIGKYEVAGFNRFCNTLVVCTEDNLEKTAENRLSLHCKRLIILKNGEAKSFSLIER